MQPLGPLGHSSSWLQGWLQAPPPPLFPVHCLASNRSGDSVDACPGRWPTLDGWRVAIEGYSARQLEREI